MVVNDLLQKSEKNDLLLAQKYHQCPVLVVVGSNTIHILDGVKVTARTGSVNNLACSTEKLNIFP